MNFLFAFYHGPQNDMTFKYKVFDGANWSDDRSVENTGGLSNTPAAVRFDNTIWLFYQRNHQLFYKSFNMGLFSNELPIPNSAGAESGVAAVVYNRLIYLFFAHPNERVLQYKTFDGRHFSDQPVSPEPPFELQGTPAAAVVGYLLYVVCRGADTSTTNNTRLWFTTFDGLWEEPAPVPNTPGIVNSPAVAAYNNGLYLFFNHPDGTFWSKSYAHSTWSADSRIPNTAGCAENAGATNFANRIYLLYPSPGNVFNYRTYDGRSWGLETQVPNTSGITFGPGLAVMSCG